MSNEAFLCPFIETLMRDNEIITHSFDKGQKSFITLKYGGPLASPRDWWYINPRWGIVTPGGDKVTPGCDKS